MPRTRKEKINAIARNQVDNKNALQDSDDFRYISSHESKKDIQKIHDRLKELEGDVKFLKGEHNKRIGAEEQKKDTENKEKYNKSLKFSKISIFIAFIAILPNIGDICRGLGRLFKFLQK